MAYFIRALVFSTLIAAGIVAVVTLIFGWLVCCFGAMSSINRHEYPKYPKRQIAFYWFVALGTPIVLLAITLDYNHF